MFEVSWIFLPLYGYFWYHDQFWLKNSLFGVSLTQLRRINKSRDKTFNYTYWVSVLWRRSSTKTNERNNKNDKSHQFIALLSTITPLIRWDISTRSRVLKTRRMSLNFLRFSYALKISLGFVLYSGHTNRKGNNKHSFFFLFSFKYWLCVKKKMLPCRKSLWLWVVNNLG